MHIALITLTLVYAVLAVVEVRLLLTYIRKGVEPITDDDLPRVRTDADDDQPLAFAY